MAFLGNWMSYSFGIAKYIERGGSKLCSERVCASYAGRQIDQSDFMPAAQLLWSLELTIATNGSFHIYRWGTQPGVTQRGRLAYDS